MSFETGLYEQLINKLVTNKLDSLDCQKFHISETPLDKEEASQYLSLYLAETIKYALNEIKEKDRPIKQIEISNKIITLLAKELKNLDLTENLIENEGRILEAVFSKSNFPYSNLKDRLKEITPYTRLSQSELFTGNNTGISLESEIKKEILSADEICWLVSFIKYSGIRIFIKELEEFTKSGKKLKIITTSYMGATDAKAVEYLASLPNTEIKVSYNVEHERLHAKAYLFLRNSGFHTGYIGSSNLSRSALTNGLEWNLKVTTQEIGHIIDKFQKTFETYWEDPEFEYYEKGKDRAKLISSLKRQSSQGINQITTFFDLKPYPYQEEILSKLDSERIIHNRNKNLLVAATGTGKTVISAFDFQRFKKSNPSPKFLFVAHRKEILEQAQKTFQHVLRDSNFGELWVGGYEPEKYDQLFASVQTLNNRLKNLPLTEDFFDYIIVDEVHHIKADSYRPILKRFNPKILLGLTATPERMDGGDITEDFHNKIAAEIRLPEALNRKLLSPFQYFALSDSIDLTNVSWKNGKYEIKELTKLYTENDRRVGDILKNCEDYLTDVNDVQALGFCVSQEHAKYMASKFNLAGLKADYLISGNSSDRSILRNRLGKKDINYLFVVDIFNEGVDIPEIDTILFLRPTESLTIFLQQLGRGLRLAENKDCLTVLDFVGNARPEYDFEHKFRALIGKTHTSVIKEIEDEFPHLPLGCSIVLEKKAKEIILKNIREATEFRRPQLVQKIQNFKHYSTRPLNLANFLEFHHLNIEQVYKKGSWSRLCAEAGVIEDFSEPNEKELSNFISNRLISCNSVSYLNYIKRLCETNFEISENSDIGRLKALMFHYDVWQKSGPDCGFKSLQESLKQIARNPVMRNEIMEVVKYTIEEIDFVEKSVELEFDFPLKIYSRYNRNQILVAIRRHKFEKAKPSREGSSYEKSINTEALFVTLKKSDKEYSPTTMYEDYALNKHLFHWQTQNSASPNTPKGQAYINSEKNVLLFVREQNKDEYGFTMGYVFLGKVEFQKYSGEKPMNIEWKLKEPMPPYILKESQKLAVG
ncbi:superfamily II DNA or RNA helicase [Christiangramia gaetbulicola]|uniref:Superfamily II DNA or RNA helicase n=1 Tax=Christiangramia gaetbulicola TaxID=703340 RepID=A0A2T6AN69_9FLAO|nr:DEAD/DEAH box helicase [Christiangramia gaetbulicola]PTX45265.1 superfamily II DNA or RNA helicase [Christiangramia gaetbulicola]